METPAHKHDDTHALKFKNLEKKTHWNIEASLVKATTVIVEYLLHDNVCVPTPNPAMETTIMCITLQSSNEFVKGSGQHVWVCNMLDKKSAFTPWILVWLGFGMNGTKS